MSLRITRQKGETVYIGEACVTITRVGKLNVGLSIEAPPGINIVRGELVDRRQRDIECITDAICDGVKTALDECRKENAAP